MRTVLAVFLWLLAGLVPALAQTLTASNVQVNWQVENRFRLFAETKDFQAHERAWKQYLIHVDGLNLDQGAEARLVANSSVLGAEHVLNDRYIPFTRHLRRNYDWKGWAATQVGRLCWDEKSRTHGACGSSEAYVVPKSHRVKLWVHAAGFLRAHFRIQLRMARRWRRARGEPLRRGGDTRHSVAQGRIRLGGGGGRERHFHRH